MMFAITQKIGVKTGINRFGVFQGVILRILSRLLQKMPCFFIPFQTIFYYGWVKSFFKKEFI